MGFLRFPTIAGVILLAVVLTMLRMTGARAEKPAKSTGDDLISITRTALDKNTAIRAGDKQKILAIVRAQLAVANVPVPCDKMPESRRRPMVELIQGPSTASQKNDSIRNCSARTTSKCFDTISEPISPFQS